MTPPLVESKKDIILQIFEEFPTAIGVFDTDLNMVFSNRALEKLLAEVGDEIFKVLRTCKWKEPVNSVLHKGGRTYGYTLYFSSEHLILFMKDITDKSFLYYISQDKKIIELINHIFSMLRHEIGNPLNTIKFSLSVLKDNIREYSEEKVLEYIHRLFEEATAIEKILLTMKQYSSIGSLLLEKVNLKALLNKVVFLSEAEFVNRGILITVDEMEDIYVKADPTALEQVLINIIKNSIDAMEGKKGEKVIEIRAHVIGQYARISVQDTGPGIPEELKDKIFLPFVTTKKRGTGMGLAISKGLISAMDGYLGLVNTESGALALVYLPLWGQNE